MSYSVDSYFRRGDRVTITADASPYGVGAFLSVNHTPIAWFAEKLHRADFDALGMEMTEDSRVQQASESMVILIALRHWADKWADRRVTLSIRSDNISTLTLLCKVSARSKALGVIARELALDIARA